MATTTTNFGWDIPQSTDLVKDGATAIAALGQDIDTAFVDLKGGSTGQVLAKASNTDLDYSWVTTDDTNAIQNAIVDAKGDLIAATAADTPARLAVGTNGQILTADSTAATGLKWATASAGFANNGILNGAMQIWQRGTSIVNTSLGYTADRYFLQSYNAMTISRQLTGDTTNLPDITYCARVQRDSGATGVNFVYFTQTIESINSRQFAGKTITFSFYARKGANYSGATSAITGEVLSGTGTDQSVLGFTGSSTVASTTGTLTTTWQRFTFTGAVPSTSNELGFYLGFTPVGTAGAADYFEITGIQLEVGSTATAFHTNQPTIATELAACQRYYWRAGGDSVYQPYGVGAGQTSTVAQFSVQNPVPMRIAPTSIDFSTLAVTDTISAFSISALGFANAGKYASSINATASSLSIYRPYIMVSNNSTSGFIGFSAEL